MNLYRPSTDCQIRPYDTGSNFALFQNSFRCAETVRDAENERDGCVQLCNACFSDSAAVANGDVGVGREIKLSSSIDA